MRKGDITCLHLMQRKQRKILTAKLPEEELWLEDQTATTFLAWAIFWTKIKKKNRHDEDRRQMQFQVKF